MELESMSVAFAYLASLLLYSMEATRLKKKRDCISLEIYWLK